MKTKHHWLLPVAGILSVIIFLIACNKENSGSSGNTNGAHQLSIYMMDDPIAFTQVLINIKQVAVKIDTAAHHDDTDDNHQWNDDYRGCRNGNSTIWDTLPVTPGIYDLMKLRNGTDTLLAWGAITSGKVLQVRITLGENNTVYTDNVTHYRLNIMGPFNFFDLNVRREDLSVLDNSQFKLWFDFNLSKSIIFFNDKYWLKPLLKPFNDKNRSKLEGRVVPQGASGFVTVYNQLDTVYALPWTGGYYQVRGLNAGRYAIYFKGWHGYKDTTITNIAMSGGGLTKVPTITLHK
ncbi:MAG: DUF4382 domain-containing protein [Bacteroidota bacterium]